MNQKEEGFCCENMLIIITATKELDHQASYGYEIGDKYHFVAKLTFDSIHIEVCA